MSTPQLLTLVVSLLVVLLLPVCHGTISPSSVSFTLPGSPISSQIYSILSTGGGTVIVAVDPLSPAFTNSTKDGTVLYALNLTSSTPILANLSLPPCHSWMIPNPLVFGFMLVCKQMTGSTWSTTTIFRIDYGLQSFVQSDPISEAYTSIVSDINQQRFLAFTSDGSLYGISWSTFAPQLLKSAIVPSGATLVSASLVSDSSALLLAVSSGGSNTLMKFGSKAWRQLNTTLLTAPAYLIVGDEQKPTTTLFSQYLPSGVLQLVSFDLSHMTALEVRNVTNAAYLPTSQGVFLWTIIDESLFFVTSVSSGKRAGPNSVQVSQAMLQNGFLPAAPSTVPVPAPVSSSSSVALSADGNFAYVAQGLEVIAFSYTSPPSK